MDRLSFGDKCSPFVAISVVHRVADDYGQDRSLTEAANAIRENFYVDDYLDSSDTTDGTVRLAQDVRDILSAVDFHLRKWTSNSQPFLDKLEPRRLDAGDEEVGLTDQNHAKILGVCWRPKMDVLSFSIHQPSDITFTRRGLLSKLASVFDPLGLAAPVTVQAKIKLKILGLGGLHWDAEIPEAEKTW